MKIELLAFDLDGTVLQKGSAPSKRFCEALEAARRQKVEIVPATGRMKTFLPESIKKMIFINYIVTSNGAAVLDICNGCMVFERFLDTSVTLNCLETVLAYNIPVELYVEGEALVDRASQKRLQLMPEEKRSFIIGKQYRIAEEEIFLYVKHRGLRPEKINLPHLPGDIRDEIVKKLQSDEQIRISSSGKGNIEINAADAGKGVGLSALCRKLGISPECVMAIGDNGNDTDMLSFAGVSVAVGNATPEAKMAAKYITDDFDKDGAAKAIERYLLK